MKGVKMWMWQGDPLAEKMYNSLGVVPVPLALPDVMMALQTKMISGVYAPPLGAIAMQWFAKTKYMSDANLVNSIGAVLMTKKAYAKMSAVDQKILKEVTDKYCKKLVSITRRDNKKSIETLKSAGIELVKVNAKNLQEFKEKSKTVWQGLSGSLYPKALLDKTVGYVEEYRNRG
jgi:TRAP-type C4-dicarboxylate transport system substrate-binding protein